VDGSEVQDADRDCEKREGEYKEGMACRRTEEVVIYILHGRMVNSGRKRCVIWEEGIFV
jgi:hypothetical protein